MKRPPLRLLQAFAKKAATRASASAWESARYRATIHKALAYGLRPANSAASPALSAGPFTVGHASWSQARDACASSPIAPLISSSLSDPAASAAWARAADGRHAAVAMSSLKRRNSMPPFRCRSYTCTGYSVGLVTPMISHMLQTSAFATRRRGTARRCHHVFRIKWASRCCRQLCSTLHFVCGSSGSPTSLSILAQAVTALLDTLCYEGIVSQRCTTCDNAT